MKENIAVLCLSKKFKKEFSVKLANILKLQFADIDEIIETKDMSIKELVKLKGDGFYEKIEDKAVRSVSELSRCVINVGINAVISEKNLNSLRENCFVIFLMMDKKTYLSELDESGSNAAKLGTMVFEERTKIFTEASDLTIKLSGKNVDAAVKQTVKLIKKG